MTMSKPPFTLTLFFVFFVVAATSSGTTSTQFRYSEKDLKSCVRQYEKNAGTTYTDAVGDSGNTCLPLYKEFLEHYRPDTSSDALASSSGYNYFLKTAHLVHEHNTKYPHVGFKLRLNQFADAFKSSSKGIHDPKEDRRSSTEHNDAREISDSWQIELEEFREDQNKEIDTYFYEPSYSRRTRKLRRKETDVRLLDTHSSIAIEKESENLEEEYTHLKLPQEEYGRKLHWEEYEYPSNLSSLLRVEKSSVQRAKVRMPGDGGKDPSVFSSPQVPPTIHGTEIELHKGTGSDDEGGTIDIQNTRINSSGNNFAKSLDWSTSHNPDGVPLVHSAFDQGRCGSSWAFAATGSVEASAARNFARDHFVAGLNEITERISATDDEDDDDFDMDGFHTMVKELTDETRRVELDAFQELDLSIQELLDCDNSIDDGCVGGNPHRAFAYIHHYGLVPRKEYPYSGDSLVSAIAGVAETTMGETTQNLDSTQSPMMEETSTSKSAPTCQKENTSSPIAAVKSWGLLHKNHEDLIEDALLYVGPVAVGINGAESSFINYGGGIFDSEDCDQNANHALLIVGYGEEEVPNEDGTVETVRYWIARNSWGESWGENGFVRVKRGSGEKGVRGVCGIARSPSVALGGFYRWNRKDPMPNGDTVTSRYRKNKYITPYDTFKKPDGQMVKYHPLCDSIISEERFYLRSGCAHLSFLYHSNKIMFLVFSSLFCALLVIFPLLTYLARQHRVTLGKHSIIRDHFSGDEQRFVTLSQRSRSTSATLSERTHLLSLKDQYADGREKKEGGRLRGQSIVMTSPERDPFNLVPSATFDESDTEKTSVNSE